MSINDSIHGSNEFKMASSELNELLHEQYVHYYHYYNNDVRLYFLKDRGFYAGDALETLELIYRHKKMNVVKKLERIIRLKRMYHAVLSSISDSSSSDSEDSGEED